MYCVSIHLGMLTITCSGMGVQVIWVDLSEARNLLRGHVVHRVEHISCMDAVVICGGTSEASFLNALRRLRTQICMSTFSLLTLAK